MPEIGIYARVSTTDQDPQRQLDELREFAEDTYDEPDIHAYTDIISGTETDCGEEYQRFRSDIEYGTLDVVIVHEISIFPDSVPAKSTTSSNFVSVTKQAYRIWKSDWKLASRMTSSIEQSVSLLPV